MPTPLSEAISMVETPEGRARLTKVLSNKPYPHFEAHPDRPGALVRVDEDGTRTVGIFMHREFVPITSLQT